jgi:HSP20 family protein
MTFAPVGDLEGGVGWDRLGGPPRNTKEEDSTMATVTPRDPSTFVNDFVSWMSSVAPGDPQIRIEEYVDGDRHVIKADIPGVDPDKDIDISVDGSLLRLRGQRREEQREKRRTEIRYGSFERALSLPSGTTADQVSASYDDGVLTVTFPEAAAPEPHKIAVSHGELPVE